MIGETTTRTRLCPKCANSIAEDAAKCPYCKTDLSSEFAPKWLNRKEPASEPRMELNSKKKSPVSSKFVWSVAALVIVLLAFVAGGYIQRTELSAISQANLKQLQVKEQIIQSQQAQLAQLQQQLSESSKNVAEMTSKLEESQKALSTTRERIGAASRQPDRSIATQSAAVRRTASRAPDAPRPFSQRVAARRTVEPEVYETTQATSVYENASSTARVISQIGSGTRLNVVSSAGDWLEVRSNRGNPPGYVRSADARPIGRAN